MKGTIDTEMSDLKRIACNYSTGAKTATEGSIAYVVQLNPGGGNDRILILSRSRGHRWIEKWEAITRLNNFRSKTVPMDNPLYRRLLNAIDSSEKAITDLKAARQREVDG